jgi:hypothetical protein
MPTVELEISPGADGGYLVSARSEAGDTGAVPARFGPLDAGTLEHQLREVELILLRSAARTRRLIPPGELPALDLGREMFEFLFHGEMREHLAAIRNQAAARDTPLQVRLRIRPPELAALPWEFLYDQSRDDYLCLSGPLIRHVEVLEPHRPLEVVGPLRILGMVSSPPELAQLDSEKERELLERSLHPLITEGAVELRWVEGRTWRDLRNAVQAGSWHVFHFIGHGAFSHAHGEGVLMLADEDGKPYPLAATDLARVLVGIRRSLRLVVLNSCQTAGASSSDLFSSTAAVLMRRGIPAVIAMQYEISDPAAIAFARGLYEAVARLLPVDQAVTSARMDVKLSCGTLEWAVPVVYLRSSSGALFAPGTGQPLAPENPRARAQPEPPATPPARPDPAPYAHQQPTGTLLGEMSHNGAVRSAEFSPNGGWFATGSDGVARLWEAVTNQQVSIVAHQLHWVWAVAFSPDSRLLATASGDKTAALWQVPTGQSWARLRHGGLVGAVTFSPDGTLLATASDDETSRLWEVGSGREVALLRHAGPVRVLAFSPGGTLLATAGDDRTARLWEVPTGKQTAQLHHDGPVQTLAFSPDGTLLATAGDDRTARLWEVPTGKQTAQLHHDGPVQTLAFSPDGTLLATAGDDRTARLWEVPTGKQTAQLHHQGGVWTLGFSPDGKRLITGSDDRSARIWAI